MTCNAVDYFATVGKSNGSLCYSKIKDLWDDCKYVNPNDIWESAIVDITVIHANEIVADTDEWEIIDKSVDGNDLSETLLTSRIAIRRRKYFSSRNVIRLDHIVDIKFANPDAIMPKGYDVIGRTVTGAHLAEIELGFGYICYKRADPSSTVALIQGSVIIDELCFILRDFGEEIPEQFEHTDKVKSISSYNRLSYGSSSSSNSDGTSGSRGSNVGASSNALKIDVCVHINTAVGMTDLSYESSTLDRYPRVDNEKVSLSESELPMFAFPHGLRLKYSLTQRFPIPIFFSFVFTDSKGEHYYVACLRFYEEVTTEELKKLQLDLYGSRSLYGLIEMPANLTVYCPKVICVVASIPFYIAMRKYLRQLYSLSLSSLLMPLEYYITTIVNQVPIPVECGRPFHVVQDLALISASSKSMSPIIFDIPSKFPHADLDFAGPLRCLSVERVLAVFTLILREEKIIFMCNSHTMLTETMETFRALLFPLSWSSCFVSRLPIALSGLLGALGGYMIGLQVLENSNCDIDTNSNTTINEEHHHTSNSYHGKHKNEWSKYIPNRTYVVDLTNNSISQYDSNHNSVDLTSKDINNMLKMLPAGPKKRLQCTLQLIATEYQLGPQQTSLKQFDSAFDFHMDESDLIYETKWHTFPTLLIRDCFMVYMIDMLGSYSKYIIPPSTQLDSDSYRTFKETFLVDDYISNAESSMRSMTEKIVQSQMFAVLIQQRLQGSNKYLIFYEKCAHLLKVLQLSAGGHGSKSTTTSTFTTTYPVIPAPMYKLQYAYDYLCLLVNGNLRCTLLPNATTVYKSRNAESCTFLSYLIQTLTLISDSNVKNSDKSYRSSINDEGLLFDIDKLHLNNASIGSILFPGPVKCSDTTTIASITSTLMKDTNGRFVYKNGWPQLNEDVLAHCSIALHPVVSTVRDIRIKSINCSTDTALLIRPYDERLKYFVLPDNIAFDSSIHLSQETHCLFNAVADIASLSIMLLQVRCIVNVKPLSDILQILGIIAQLEDRELVTYLHECTYKGLLKVCKQAKDKKDVVIQIAIAVYESLLSHNIDPDAMTFGLYHEALLSQKTAHPHSSSSSSSSSGGGSSSGSSRTSESMFDYDTVDAFVYLEDIGKSWLCQRFSMMSQPSYNKIIHTSIEEDKNQYKVKRTPGSTMMSSMLGLTKLTLHDNTNGNNTSTAATDSNASSASPAMKKRMYSSTGVTDILSSKFSLGKASGMLSFVSPKNASIRFISPKKVNDFSIDEVKSITDTCKKRLHRLHLTSKDFEDIKRRTFSGDSVDVATATATTSYTSRSSSSSSSVTRRGNSLSFDSASESPTRSQLSSKLSRFFTFSSSATTAATATASPVVSRYSDSAPNSASPGVAVDGTIRRSSFNKLKDSIARAAEDVLPSRSSSCSNDDNRPVSLQDVLATSSASKDSIARAAEDVLPSRSSSCSNDDNRPVSLQDVLATSSASNAVHSDQATVGTQETFDNDSESDSDSDDEDDCDDVTVGGTSKLCSSANATTTSTVRTGSEDDSCLLESLKLQDDTQAMLENQMKKHNTFVGMYAHTVCVCGCSILDEEIIASWYFSDAVKSNRFKRNINANDLQAIKCPNCMTSHTPQLHVNAYVKNDDMSVCVSWSKSVQYLSPYTMRSDYEGLIEDNGVSVVSNPAELIKINEDIYWNILWYSTRLNLPSGFSACVDDSSSTASAASGCVYDGPISIGSKECAIAQYAKIFFDVAPDGNNCLRLIDLIPTATPQLIEDIYHSLDRLETTGMHDLIMCIGLFHRISHCNNDLFCRALYIDVLSVVHFADKVLFPDSNRRIHVEKDYSDAVRLHLTDTDLHSLHVEVRELLMHVSSRASQTFRLGFGYLL